MDQCESVKIQNRGGEKYILVVVDDYSRVLTMFLMSKDKTYDVFIIFAKMIQTKLNCKIARIRFDHGTKFENAKRDIFYAEMKLIKFLSSKLLNKMVW